MDVQETKKIASYWSNFFKTPSQSTDVESVLANMSPFRNLSQKYLKLLMKIVHYRDYDKDEYIFCEGDPGVGLFIVQNGSVEIYLDLDKNQKRKIAEFDQGDFFGDMALLDETPRSASAIAAENTRLAVIFKPDLDEFIDRHPVQGVSILRGLSQIIASRLRILNKDYTELFNIVHNNSGEQEDGTDKENISTG